MQLHDDSALRSLISADRKELYQTSGVVVVRSRPITEAVQFEGSLKDD